MMTYEDLVRRPGAHQQMCLKFNFAESEGALHCLERVLHSTFNEEYTELQKDNFENEGVI